MYEEVCKMKKNRQQGVLITCVDRKGQGPSTVGKKILLYSTGEFKGTIGGGELEYLALQKAKDLLKEQRSTIQSYDFTGGKGKGDSISINMICGGIVTLYFEYIGLRPDVYIFGAGHVGKCISTMLAGLDYRVVIIDDRGQRPENMPENQEFYCGNYSEIIRGLDFGDDCFIVVAAYNHDLEYEVLRGIYEKGCKPSYIGLLASKNKASYMVKRLREELGGELDFGMLYAPVGLDIGGTSPQEIAISIVSEIQALRYKKEGQKHMTADWA
ncbi:XdhC family protein [Fonticella tunisiensis]|nr:XdhC/CoxI family protein [Fonticella tunisiensis]